MPATRRQSRTTPTNPAPAVKTIALPVVEANPAEAKSGCYWCSLLPFAPDFSRHESRFQRDAEKIKARLHDPHHCHHRGISEPWEPVDLLIVADMPKVNEDRKGLPLAGGALGMVRKVVAEIMGNAHTVGFTNLVRCRPPRNRAPNRVEIVACSHELVREIKARKPKLVMALGNKSLEFLTEHSGITLLCGRVLKAVHPELRGMDVLACVHPDYVLVNDHELEKFAQAFVTAHEFLTGTYDPGMGEGVYTTLETPDEVERVLGQMLADKKKLAFDTETGSLSCFETKWPHLLCFSFSNQEGTGYTVPWDHADSPWRAEEAQGSDAASEWRSRVRKMVTALLTSDIPKVAQNEKFDRQHIRAELGIEVACVVRDTLLTHLVLDDRRGVHGLDMLAHAFTGMGSYDKELERYTQEHPEADVHAEGSYANVPGKVLFRYAAQDADVTLRVDNAMVNDEQYLNSAKFRALANEVLPALSVTLSKMEFEGALVNPAEVEALNRTCLEGMEKAETAVYALPKVRQFEADRLVALREQRKTQKGKDRVTFRFNPGSDQQVASILFDYYGCRPNELTETGEDVLTARWEKAVKSNPRLSFDAVVDDAIAKKQWQFFSVKGDVLHDLDRKGNDLASHILAYRHHEKLRGSFVEPLQTMVDSRGFIHGTFLVHGTVTGRLSSKNPNLQNIPLKARGAYHSRFGDHGVILQADYSQIELRVAASWFNEPAMIKAYREGADLHKLTAIDISGLSTEAFKLLDKDEAKAWRTRAKRINFGILYGGGPPALQLTLRKDGVFVTVKECEKLIERYFEVRPALRAGIERLNRRVIRDGYLDSFTGRRRRVPQVRSEDRGIVSRALRQSVNFPIQSGAADMTLMSLVLIDREMEKRKLQSKMIITVHDSIVFDCHVDELFELATLVKDIMETLPARSDEVLSGVSWDWLKVPIVAELEVGVDWYRSVGFDPKVVSEGGHDDSPLFGDDGKGGVAALRAPVNVDELWELMGHRAAS
jgi:uracil-DNA glycosylase family 4